MGCARKQLLTTTVWVPNEESKLTFGGYGQTAADVLHRICSHRAGVAEHRLGCCLHGAVGAGGEEEGGLQGHVHRAADAAASL
jgi:hypothetical protein